ncbi:MAG: lamin tail domain-containing protein [Leptospirales bacterium]|nr:lamin tail domain-containing protein [Leptospirales bacterium]
MSRFIRFIFIAFLLCVAAACKNLDDAAAKGFLASRELFADQGYVYFDDTGNITVEFNNTEFYRNPLYNAASFIAVWVFPRGANPNARCCEGSNCTAIELKSCVVGFGFSNDLAFTGQFYFDLNPVQPFNPYADKYYIPVFAAGKDSVPASYQGEYTTLSSPTGIVNDRQQFDLYIGVFQSITHPNPVIPHRLTNEKRELSGTTYYTAIDPDWLSPVIQVEARFYPQNEGDPPGSMYIIPSFLSWAPHGEIQRFEDYRNRVLINELVGNPSGTDGNTGSPELAEIVNKTGGSLSMFGWRLSVSGANTIDLGVTVGTECLATTTIPANAYLVLAYYTDTAQANGDPASDCDFSDGAGRLKVAGVSGMTTGTGSARLFSDAGTTIVDYVQYTTSSCSVTQTGLSTASKAGIWTTGSCTTGNDYIRRLPDATDTNVPGDWTGSAIPGGVPTPGAPNT